MLITACVNGMDLSFETAQTVFSPAQIDRGTLAMLETVLFAPGEKILDLGCGYGVVGICAAKMCGAENIVMTDIDPKCVSLSQKNAALNGVSGIKIIQSDGFRQLNETQFTYILSNPPYHADFSVPKHFIEKGFNRLIPGGCLIMVTKRLDWYKNKLTAIFGGVKITEANGYFIFRAEKRNAHYFKK